MQKLVQLATAFIITAVPALAGATVYNVHLGGVGSTQWTGGKGGGYLGQWGDGSVSVEAYVDQRDSMATATEQLAGVLDTYCTGNNLCYLYTYSNGGAVISRTLSLYSTAWNIGYSANSASAEGGTEIGDAGWLGEIFGGCYLAGHIGVSAHRNGWNHYDTKGIVFGHIGGNGWLAPYAQSSVLPGHDDGAVACHSAGGYASAISCSSGCSGSSKYTNHQQWWSCEYGSLNHYDLKMKAICNDGGATGCK